MIGFGAQLSLHPPAEQFELVQRLEAVGYDSVWTGDHMSFHNPIHESITLLASYVPITRRIRLGVGVYLLALRSPAVAAKQAATLDVLSGGRLDVGLGLGWSEDEYEAVGVPYRARGRRGDEFLRCLDMIWTQDVIEFHGEFYNVPRCRVEPKPVQKPHPPITIGGYGSTVVRRAVELGDGFNGGNVPMTSVAPLVREVREAAAARGRDPASLHIVCRGSYRLHDAPQGPDRRPLWGTLDEIREDIGRYADAGLTELFLEGNFAPGGPSLEQTLEVMTRLAPRG